MELWRKTWRNGFVPLLSDAGLLALAEALRQDDPRVIQGATTSPPPLRCVRDGPVEAACPLRFIGVIDNGGFGEATVAECEEFFVRVCFDADQILMEPAACRHFLNWYDETPRDEMRRELLAETERAIASRRGL